MQMSLVPVDSNSALPRPMIVAVAVKGGGSGGGAGRGSRRAVWWAAEKLMHFAHRVVLVHVMPKITSIPLTAGGTIPIEQLGAEVVEIYVEGRKSACEEIFLPFKKLFKRRKIETLVLEGDNPASALLEYVTDFGISTLVLGSCEPSLIMRVLPSFITREQKEPTVPSVVLNKVPEACNVFIVSRLSILTNSANPWSTRETSARNWWSGRGWKRSIRRYRIRGSHYNSLVDRDDTASTTSDASHLYAMTVAQPMYPDDPDSIVQPMCPDNPEPLQERNHQNSANRIAATVCPCAANGCCSVNRCPCPASRDTKQSPVQAEIERMRLELMKAVFMYNQAREDLAVTKDKITHVNSNTIRLLSSQCLKEAQLVNDALRSEEIYRKIFEEEQSKHLEALKDIERAKEKLAILCFSNFGLLREHTLELRTQLTSEIRRVRGEMSVVPVDKNSALPLPRPLIVAVAVKGGSGGGAGRGSSRAVWWAAEKLVHFAYRVVLVHVMPRITSIPLASGGTIPIEQLGADVVEMYVQERKSACQEIFLPFKKLLQRRKIETLVLEGDNPASALLEYVTDFGVSMLVLGSCEPSLIMRVLPSFITREQKEPTVPSVVLDKAPEACSVFSVSRFSILTNSANPWSTRENSARNWWSGRRGQRSIRRFYIIRGNHFYSPVDRDYRASTVYPSTIVEPMYPVNNPDLLQERNRQKSGNRILPPNHFFCPILLEVMRDPYIAADGFTYEYRAIKAWLERHSLSPVTKRRLQHKVLIQNHTLRYVIEDWKSRITSTSG